MSTYTRPDATLPAIAEDGGRTDLSPGDVAAGWSTVSQTRPPAATFNAKDFYTSSAMKYLCRLGIAEYSPTESYQGLGMCIGSNGSVYWNLVPSQGIDPVGDNGNTWEKLPIRLRDALGLIGVPGGPEGSVQFNSSGSFGGREGFAYDSKYSLLKVGQVWMAPTNGSTALSLDGTVAEGARCGISCPDDYPNLYIDSRNLLIFQSLPDRWGTMNSSGLLIGGADGIYQATHRLDICGASGGAVVAWIDQQGNITGSGLVVGNQSVRGYGWMAFDNTRANVSIGALTSAIPIVSWANSPAPVNARRWSAFADQGQMKFTIDTDDTSASTVWMQVTRNLMEVERIEIYAQLKQIVSGSAVGLQGNVPLTETDYPGSWMSWNQTQGQGETDFVNYVFGPGGAGFHWYSLTVGTAVNSQNPLMTLDKTALTVSGGVSAMGPSYFISSAQVDGKLTANGGFLCNGRIDVNGDLEVGGTFVADTTITCLSDIQVNGRINGLGSAILNGTVAIPIAGKTYNTVQVGQYAGRSFNVVYQNTSSMTRQLSITYTTTGGSIGYVTANVGPTNPPTNQVFKDENTASVNGSECAITLLLPPGWFISLGSSGDVTGIGHWWEWDCP